jgi:superkiller protein 3
MEKQGQFAQAMGAYEESVKQDPKRPDAHLRLAILLDQQGKFEVAQEHYKKALALQPGSADIYCCMGYSFYLQQRWGEAEMNLRQALALEPGQCRSHNNLGLVLAQTGKRQEALAEFRKGGCKESEAHANLAFVLALKRDLPDASAEYEHALAADPSLQVARKGLQEVKVLQARFVTGEN